MGMWSFFELVQLFLPEITMFLCAFAGLVLFSGQSVIAQVEKLWNGNPATKKVADEDAPLTEDELKSLEVEKELAKGNDARAIGLWRETKLTGAHSGVILGDIVEAMRREGRDSLQAIVTELQQMAEMNPKVCEDDTMECLFFALASAGEVCMLKALAEALDEVKVLTPRLRLALAAIALRKPEKLWVTQNADLTEALGQLQQLPHHTIVPPDLAAKLLCVAGM